MAYRDSTTNSGQSTTPSVAVPSGATTDDIVILAASIDSNSAAFDSGDLPAGFTELREQQCTADRQTSWIGWKRLTEADAGSYTFGNVGANAHWVCQAVALSGRHTADPPVASAAAVQNTAQSSPVSVGANGVTALDGDDLVWCGCGDVLTSGGGDGFTPPSDYTEAEDAENVWVNQSLAYRANVSAGATGTVTGTFALSSGTSGWIAFLVRVPAAAGGGAAGQPAAKRFGGVRHVPGLGPGRRSGARAW